MDGHPRPSTTGADQRSRWASVT